jgi:hypothetical protein
VESGTVIQLRGPNPALKVVVNEDVPRLIDLLGLTDQQIAERLNHELGITLVSAGVVRLWARGCGRPPIEWIETLARFRRPGRGARLAQPRAS